MSYTEITYFGKAKVIGGDEVHNSWRGAMAVWDYFWNKYFKDEDKGSPLSDGWLKKVWELFNTDKLSRAEKIVLGSTFDHVMVKRENVDEMCRAFDDLNIGSLPEQAKAIREAMNNKKIRYICWNQTSVNWNEWNEYSLNKGKDHWFLFDELV